MLMAVLTLPVLGSAAAPPEATLDPELAMLVAFLDLHCRASEEWQSRFSKRDFERSWQTQSTERRRSGVIVILYTPQIYCLPEGTTLPACAVIDHWL